MDLPVLEAFPGRLFDIYIYILCIYVLTCIFRSRMHWQGRLEELTKCMWTLHDRRKVAIKTSLGQMSNFKGEGRIESKD